MEKLNKCFIVGCVRNCGKYLDNVFNNVIKITKLFNEYKIIIAYDNSDDNSLDILLEKQKNIDNFILLVNQNELSWDRVINITNARNLILNKIKEELYDDSWNYYINLDFDNVCSSSINIDILNKYLVRDDWDSLSFNKTYDDIKSFHDNGYYDIWALSYDPYIFSCWHWDNSYNITFNIMKPDIENKLKELNEDELFCCFSAFNGFAIYKLEKFINCSYNYSLKENIEYMPEDILENNKKLFDYNISYHNDIDCEHRKFHLEAIKKNNARIRISPLFLFT